MQEKATLERIGSSKTSLIFNKATGREAGKVWVSKNTSSHVKGLLNLKEGCRAGQMVFMTLYIDGKCAKAADGKLQWEVVPNLDIKGNMMKLRCMKITNLEDRQQEDAVVSCANAVCCYFH